MDLRRRRGSDISSVQPPTPQAEMRTARDEPAAAKRRCNGLEANETGPRTGAKTWRPGPGKSTSHANVDRGGNVLIATTRLATERRARPLRKETGSRREQTLKGQTPWTAPRWKRLGKWQRQACSARKPTAAEQAWNARRHRAQAEQAASDRKQRTLDVERSERTERRTQERQSAAQLWARRSGNAGQRDLGHSTVGGATNLRKGRRRTGAPSVRRERICNQRA